MAREIGNTATLFMHRPQACVLCFSQFTQPTSPMTIVQHPTFNRLRAAILATEAAKEAESEARAETLALIVRDYGSQTVKVEWGQIQVPIKRDYTFRDGGVTAAQKEVDRLKKQLREAEKILKGAQEAAKAAGGARARIVRETPGLRIVRGDEG
jgi:uncharacterized protein HemY